MLDKIKYIAAYRTQPVSAITHYAPVSRIEPYGEGGKYKVRVFGERQAHWAHTLWRRPAWLHAGVRVTRPFSRLQKAHTLTDVLGKS